MCLRYHLQAFRHLYVLAAKPRIVIPHDVDSGRPCFVPLQVKFKVSIGRFEAFVENIVCVYIFYLK